MGMKDYMIKKAAFAVIAMIAVFLFNFILPRMMPGNPMMFVMGGVKLEPETREMLIRRFGLDKSVWEQFHKIKSNEPRRNVIMIKRTTIYRK